MTNDPTFLLSEDVALWSRWRTCRHVYRFDRMLSSELCETEIRDSMPTDAVRRIPYPCAFVEAPIDTTTMGGETVRADGFFYWLDYSLKDNASDISRGESLNVLFVYPEKPRTVMSVCVEFDTIGEAVREMCRFDRRETDYVRSAGVRVDISDDYETAVRRKVQAVVNHVLYIISANGDQRIVYVPSGRSKKKRACRSTVHDVGARAGRAIGAPSVRYVDGDGTKADENTVDDNGRRVRPHVRAGHWHHYRTGQRSDPKSRKLIIRWVMPTFVHGGHDEDTVTHDVKRQS